MQINKFPKFYVCISDFMIKTTLNLKKITVEM